MTNALHINWTEVSSTGIATSRDPDLGGIIDQCISDKTWFVIFNSAHIESIEGLPSREAAFAAHNAAIHATYELVGA